MQTGLGQGAAGSRALLVKIKRDLENHVRGLLKNLGLLRASRGVDRGPSGADSCDQTAARSARCRRAAGQRIDRKVMKLARRDAQVGRFMTVPGIGPITALAFKATIDDPARFARSRSVGAYVGLTSRRTPPGRSIGQAGISKCGDAMLRRYPFEAAGVLLTRAPKWSAVKAWGVTLAKRCLARALPRSCRTGGKKTSLPARWRW